VWWRVRSIQDVAASQMCCGCGACASLDERLEMIDVLEHGRRPRLRHGAPSAPVAGEALAACPGISLAHLDPFPAGHDPALAPAWGPILELWEGYAADPELRHAASSGGAASVLALEAIERRGFHGVLHIAARPDVPYLNRTVLSRTRAELLAATGSRYAPASPCDRLGAVEAAPSPCVFIGKPCDVAGAAAAARRRPRLAERLGLTIGIFCAGTPSTRGTLEMLRRMGIDDPSKVTSVRYRGLGWPGRARATAVGPAGGREASLSYDESWGEILQKHRQWRCHVCADHTGEFADIAVGDPWYREIPPDEPGRSLILVRTERGRAALRDALASGALVAERVGGEILDASQPNLRATRGAVGARVLFSRLLGAAAPRYRGFSLGRGWWRDLTPTQKLRSVTGTLSRVFRRRLRGRAAMEEYRPPPPSPAG
jgi:coenzyme F420 hydrogenase subunit beta